MSFISMGERCAVVGAGPAGLLAARALASQGQDVTIFEESAKIGGRVSQIEVGGVTVDAGAESFSVANGAVAKLACELGLGDDIVAPTAAPAWVVSPDAAYPLPAAGWLGIPVEPLDPAVVNVIGNAAARGAHSEASQPLPYIPHDITVGELVRSRLGDVIADLMVDPVVRGVYSRSIDDIQFKALGANVVEELRAAGSLLALARARRTGSPAGFAVHGIAGGMWRLTEALANDARSRGARIVTASRVTAIRSDGGTWIVEVTGGSHIFDRVVLAAPGATDLVGMPGRREAVAIVTLVIDNPYLDAAPRGTGVLTSGNVTRAKALTHSTAKWTWLARASGGKHVVRLSYALPDAREDVVSRAPEDASTLLGVDVTECVEASAVCVWPDSAPKADVDTNPDHGLYVVGAAAGLSGLAAIVAESGDFS